MAESRIEHDLAYDRQNFHFGPVEQMINEYVDQHDARATYEMESIRHEWGSGGSGHHLIEIYRRGKRVLSAYHGEWYTTTSDDMQDSQLHHCFRVVAEEPSDDIAVLCAKIIEKITASSQEESQ